MRQLRIIHSLFLAVVATTALDLGQALAAKAAVSDDISNIKLDLDDDDAKSLPVKAQPSRLSNSAKKPKAVQRLQSGPVSDLDRRIARAHEAQKKQDEKAVIEELRDLTMTLPRNGLLMLARAYRLTDENLQSIRVLQLCLAKHPKDYVVHSMLGDALAKAKKSEEALNAYQQARDINPKYQAAYDGMLNEYERVGEFYEARAILSDMIKMFGALPRYHTALCRLYSREGFLEKSVEVCEIATQQDPEVAENFVYLGESLKDQLDAPRANKILQSAATRFPASELVQSTAGSMQAEQKDFRISYKLFKQAVVADPNSTRALVGLANASFELQKNDEALDAFIKACHVDRKITKEFRLATSKLRARKDEAWQGRFEEGLASCN